MGNKNILIIEDEVVLLELLEEVLNLEKLECDCVSSGQEGIDAFYKGNYSIVILDMTLPDITGFDVISAIREKSSDTYIVVSTGNRRPELDAISERDPRCTVFYKPFDVFELTDFLIQQVA